MPGWLLVSVSTAGTPATLRVHVRRRLRGLGAVYLRNSVCLLPAVDEAAREAEYEVLERLPELFAELEWAARDYFTAPEGPAPSSPARNRPSRASSPPLAAEQPREA